MAVCLQQAEYITRSNSVYGKAALEKIIKKIEDKVFTTEKTHIEVDQAASSFTIFLPAPSGVVNVKTYSPDKTPLEFHHCNDFVRIIMGPVGSGKSVANLADIIFRLSAMPKCLDGVRRARWCIVRNTYRELAETTIKSFDSWFGELGVVKSTKAPLYRFLSFNDQYGPCELEILPKALDRPDQASAIMSLELTGCYFNEVNYIPKEVFDRMQARVGRFPSKIDMNDQEFWNGIIADCNPPDNDHWIFDTFESGKDHPSFTLFKQPPGLVKTDNGWVENPERENKKWLPIGYYLKIAANKTLEYIKVFCLGMYGIATQGKPIFPNYNDDTHGVNSIQPMPTWPLYFGFDFGLTPACVIAQLTPDGRLQIIGECTSEWMDLKQFLSVVLNPYLARRFPNFVKSEAFIDPAGIQRAQTDGQSCFLLLRESGWNAKPASSNDLLVRFRAVNQYLDSMVNGKPRFELDKSQCPVLRKALMDGYQFKELRFAKGADGTPIFDEKPFKNKYSHIAEALQYLALGLVGNDTSVKFDESKIRSSPKTVWG